MKTLTAPSNDTARRWALIESEQLELAIQGYRGNPATLMEVTRELRALVSRLESGAPCKAK